jgi:lysozyme
VSIWSAYKRFNKIFCIPQLNILTATPVKEVTKMKTSQEGVALIKKFEGCELNSYQCSAGVFTIGYGHTLGVEDGDTCTQEEAEDMLKDDLGVYEEAVDRLVKVELDQNQFDALVAWTFNLGETNLRESTLLNILNKGNYGGVPEQIKRWNRAGGQVLDGLIRRRQAEALLFEGRAWESV